MLTNAAYSVSLAWYNTEFGLRRVNQLFCTKEPEERQGFVLDLWPVNFVLQRVSCHAGHACMHTYIHTYIRTYIHIHTYTHTHTLKQPYVPFGGHPFHENFGRVNIRKAKRTALLWVITQRLVVNYYRRFGTTCRSLPLLAA